MTLSSPSRLMSNGPTSDINLYLVPILANNTYLDVYIFAYRSDVKNDAYEFRY